MSQLADKHCQSGGPDVSGEGCPGHGSLDDCLARTLLALGKTTGISNLLDDVKRQQLTWQGAGEFELDFLTSYFVWCDMYCANMILLSL